jgi:hypothetical protein
MAAYHHLATFAEAIFPVGEIASALYHRQESGGCLIRNDSE